MSQCPITYESCSPEKYSKPGLNKLLRGLPFLELFPAAQIQGQPVGELDINWPFSWSFGAIQASTTAMAAKHTRAKYLLIPPAKQYLQSSENLDLSMRLAALCGIQVPFHGMLHNQDGTLTYFVEIPGSGRAPAPYIPCAQTMKSLNHPVKPGSIEALTDVLQHACTFPVVEKYHLFRRILFSWIISYEAQSWKDFFLLQEPKKIRLAPPLFFVNTFLFYGKQGHEMGLTLSDKASEFELTDFTAYLGSNVLGLSEEAVQHALDAFRKAYGPWRQMVSNSFLSEELKEQYLDVVVARLSRLKI